MANIKMSIYSIADDQLNIWGLLGVLWGLLGMLWGLLGVLLEAPGGALGAPGDNS